MKLANLFLISPFLLLISLIISAPVFATWRLNHQGEFNFESPGQILGRNTSLPAQANQAAQDKARPVQITEVETEANSPNPANDKLKLIRLNPNNQEKLNLQLINKRGVDLETLEASSASQIIIEPPAHKENIEIRTKNQAAYIIKNKVATNPNFPLMINPETNELMVTTPNGTKTVTILPDKAVENMLAANVLDQIGGKGALRWYDQNPNLSNDSESTQSAQLDNDQESTPGADLAADQEATSSVEPDQDNQLSTQANYVIDMDLDEDGTLSYSVSGTKSKKLFGLFRVELNRTAIVSAETGELIRVKQDFPTKVLDLFSTSI